MSGLDVELALQGRRNVVDTASPLRGHYGPPTRTESCGIVIREHPTRSSDGNTPTQPPTRVHWCAIAGVVIAATRPDRTRLRWRGTAISNWAPTRLCYHRRRAQPDCRRPLLLRDWSGIHTEPELRTSCGHCDRRRSKKSQLRKATAPAPRTSQSVRVAILPNASAHAESAPNADPRHAKMRSI